MSATQRKESTSSDPQNKRLLKRLAPVLWVVLGISVPMSWLLWRLLGPREPLLISPETMGITAPVTADGYVDYSTYILQQYGDSPVIPGETAMGILWREAASRPEEGHDMRNDFRRLPQEGMMPCNRSLISYVYRDESSACDNMAFSFLDWPHMVPERKHWLVSLPTELPPREIQEKVDTHFRYARLNELQKYHRKPRHKWTSWKHWDVFLRWRWAETSVKWNETLRFENQLIDRIRDDVCTASTFQEQSDLLRAIDEDEWRNESCNFVNRDSGSSLVPQAYKYISSAVELTAHYRFAHIAWYLADWKAEYGAYPERLQEVKPQEERGSRYENIFTDPFSNQPFLYERRGDGFVLYSVGHNFKDDFGLNAFRPSEYFNEAREDIRTGRRPDDIVLKWPLK